MAHVFLPLLNAIADVVAGDGSAGLQNLEVVQEMPANRPSLEWAARIWSARASAQMPKGLEAAAAHAEAALRIAAGLDAEAQAMSGGLVFAESKPKRENGGARSSCSPARAAPSSQHFENRCLLAPRGQDLGDLEREQEERRRRGARSTCCPWWQPAVTFIVNTPWAPGACSMRNGRSKACWQRRPSRPRPNETGG